MADPDIPLAMPVPLAPPAPTAPPQQSSSLHLTSGESSTDNARPLSASTLSILAEQGYTNGLAQALCTNKRAFALSIWVVDNSGSMQSRDGQKIVETKDGGLKFVTTSRWSEMQQTVDYHAQMAALLKSPTVFRMLNDPGRVAGPQQFSIAQRGPNFLDEDLAVAQSTMINTQPGGVTPLTQHLREIRQDLITLEPELRRNGTKVAIVLATDGLPTDAQGYSNATVKRQFVDALRALEGLPVWIVVRLCTDEESVVEYWNELDNNLELSLEVLDDFSSEAAEVYEQNKWLTYGLPLHRMREMGFHHSIFDLIDERQLSKDELRGFLRILFGPGLMDEAPDPEADWKGFCEVVAELVAKEKKQWNPVLKKMTPWIDVKRLNKEYGHGGWFGLW